MTGAGRRMSVSDYATEELTSPASSAMATLVSSAALLPLAGIDGLEFSLDDRSHLCGGVGRHATRDVSEGRGLVLEGHGQSDLAMFGDPVRPLNRAEDTVFVDRFKCFPHRFDRSRLVASRCRAATFSPGARPWAYGATPSTDWRPTRAVSAGDVRAGEAGWPSRCSRAGTVDSRWPTWRSSARAPRPCLDYPARRASPRAPGCRRLDARCR